MALGGEKLAGFNTDQKKSLQKFIAEQGFDFLGALETLNKKVEQLSARVKHLEAGHKETQKDKSAAQSKKD